MKPCTTCRLSALCKSVGYQRAIFNAAKAKFGASHFHMNALYHVEKWIVPGSCPEPKAFFATPESERTYVDESAVFRGEPV